MEASKKPQLPLDSTDEGTVRVLEDRIVVEGMTIADRDAARVVRERAEVGEEPARTVRRSIEIGARVLDREDTAAEVDFVRREFERMAAEHREQMDSRNQETAERFEAEIRRAFGAEDSGGLLATALESHSTGLSEQLAELFDDGRDSAVQTRIKAMLEARDQEFMQRLSAEDEANPLRPLLSAVRNWAKERREDQDARDSKLEEKLDQLLQEAAELAGVQRGSEGVAEAEQAGTRKGRSFEERVNDAIERLADARGDAAFHVGDDPGKGGTKKGDTVVELEAAAGSALERIVFESKDKRLSKKDAWDELNAAMAEREASFAVLVVAGEQRIPAGREQLHEYEGNKLIVAVDPDEPDELGLDLAYRYARCRAVLQREGELEMDAPAVRGAAEEALSALKQAQSIKLHLTKAENGISAARSGVEEMADAVRERLERIEALVAAPQ